MPEGLTLEKLKIDDRLREVELHMAANNITLKQISETLDKLDVKVGIQNGRVNKLENIKTYAAGAVGAIGGIFTFVYFIVDKLTKGH